LKFGKRKEKLMPRYPEVRKVLSAPYSGMSSEQIERIMESHNVNADDMENFLSTLGNIGRNVVSALPSALPMVGTVLGGPVGGMLGGLAGQAVGSLAQGQRPAAGRPQQATPQPSQLQPVIQQPVPPLPAASVQIPRSSPAAAQLLQTLFRPETLQALIAMLMGELGRQNVAVGTTSVPNGGFTNLLSVLANQAAAEHAAHVSQAYRGENLPSYLQNFAIEAYGDPAIPEHRAAALLELLQESDIEQDESYERYSSFQVADETDEEIDEALYDEMDLNELYGEYEFA
jgi:hypothetical protein